MTKKNKVMIFGTFDGLHPGHFSFFRQAKKYGSLIAVVARNSTVKVVKGRLALFGERTRLAAVKSVKIIIRARLGHKTNRCKVVYEERPDIICLGYDQILPKKLENQIKNLGVKIIRLKPYKPEIYKSSKLFRKN